MTQPDCNYNIFIECNKRITKFSSLSPGPDDESSDNPKSRRSLQFATPKSKTKTDSDTCSNNTKNTPPQKTCDLNSSSLSAALNDSQGDLNNTILSDDEVDGVARGDDKSVPDSGTSRVRDSQGQKKRNATETELLAAEADDFFDSLPDLGKRVHQVGKN